MAVILSMKSEGKLSAESRGCVCVCAHMYVHAHSFPLAPEALNHLVVDPGSEFSSIHFMEE